LLQALPAWEQEHQRPFCINGERIIETIQAALDAKQAEKDLKQVRRHGPFRALSTCD
jgi:protein regulator of cytokinesis 1